MVTISQWWMWLIFFVFVAAILGIDLFYLGGRHANRVSTKRALLWTTAWVLLTLLFNFLLWLYLSDTHGPIIAKQKAIEFFTGYVIEKTLSIDNVFVILMIFTTFNIPTIYQRRVLMYGVLGAIVMRLLLILFGIYLINQFTWILLVFGLFLLFTGIKLLFFGEKKTDITQSKTVLWLKKYLKVQHELEGERFFVRHNRVLSFTPLFLALVLVELSDLLFAVDSIPAIFAITRDPFIVFTSNIFAILGLRALYFLLMNMHEKFHLLKYGIACVLIFIGVKMVIADWVPIQTGVSLCVIVLILVAAMLVSVVHQKNRE